MLTVDINIRTNGTWKYAFVWADTEGDPVALPADALVLDVRRKATDAEALVRLTSEVGGGIAITNAAAGEFTLEITKDQLGRIGAGTFVHDLVPIIAGERFQPLWAGTLNIEQGVTR